MTQTMNKILDNNKWYYDGCYTLGRTGNWLNLYWYSYKDTTEDSDIFFSDKEEKVKVKMFKIWNRMDEEYTRVGVLPNGELVMYAGTVSNHPWGMTPGTMINCKSYKVRTIKDVIRKLGLNGYDVMELVALRCAC